LTSSDSLQTPVRDTTRYSDTIKVSHSFFVRLEKEEMDEGDEEVE